ncbi:unnamed protein product [Cuscuta epithymum]|uniref:Retroviral polymerase SH3-like domain-containing protein n=1 Tax=Cuscuta epithymum TaxID=186058 RepID=A0AAV0DNM2_9ASTE|nr:unnamed protein product [Cuscuta epithymum]
MRSKVSKLDPKSIKCVFLGYSRLQKGYRCYYPSLGRYLISEDVTSFEETPFFQTNSSSSPPLELFNDEFLVYPPSKVSPSTFVQRPPPQSLLSSCMPCDYDTYYGYQCTTTIFCFASRICSLLP